MAPPSDITGREQAMRATRRGVMRRFLSVGLLMVSGLLLLPSPAKATTIDEIIFEGGGGVNPSVLHATATFSQPSASTLQIVLTNTSTGATGGDASTNLLTDIGFTLPTGVTIANT